MAKNISNALRQKRVEAARQLRECSSVIVALSGGVDSAVLLAVALEALGPARVLAVTASSPSLPASELDQARAVAASLGARHEVVKSREMEREGYRANAGDRCFHCRTELFQVLTDLARQRAVSHVAYGAIKEDEGDFRPGMRAADIHGILAPLQRAGFTKDDVRELARKAGISVSDKPASACLASRIPVGTPVTLERLAQVEKAEAAMRHLGFKQFRVRHHDRVARLELDDDGNLKIQDQQTRQRVVEAIRQAGFRFVAVDLEGYRQGSLNPTDTPPHLTGPARGKGQ